MSKATGPTLAVLLALVLAASAPLAQAQPVVSLSALQGSHASAVPRVAVGTDPHIAALFAQVDPAVLYQTVGDLSGEWPVMVGSQIYTITTRHTFSGEPLRKATQYAGEHFQNLGLEVEYHTWQAGIAPNVIGQLPNPAGAGEALILCGHVDDLPAGSLAPGADDNASGSAAVLAAATILSRYAWTCDLRFALWTGEEQGLLGSRAYAARARSRGEEILGVVNLDMIGYNSDGAPIVDLHADSNVPDSVALADFFAGVVDAYGLELQPEVFVDQSLRTRSDSWSFLEQGYAAILAIEDYDDFNPYYHTVGDELSMLDMAYYAEFVRAAIGVVAHAGCFPQGRLEGRVRDAWTEIAIPGVTVTLSDSFGITYTVATDVAGAYGLEAMAGTYKVRAVAPGYLPLTVAGTLVPTGTVATLDLVMAPAGSLAWQLYLPVVTQ